MALTISVLTLQRLHYVMVPKVFRGTVLIKAWLLPGTELPNPGTELSRWKFQSLRLGDRGVGNQGTEGKKRQAWQGQRSP